MDGPLLCFKEFCWSLVNLLFCSRQILVKPAVKLTTSFLMIFTQSIRRWSFQSMISSVTHLCCLLQVSLIRRSMTFQLSIKVATDEKIASTTCLINEVKHLFKLIFGHIAAPLFQHYCEQTAKDKYSGIKIEERAQFGQCFLLSGNLCDIARNAYLWQSLSFEYNSDGAKQITKMKPQFRQTPLLRPIGCLSPWLCFGWLTGVVVG